MFDLHVEKLLIVKLLTGLSLPFLLTYGDNGTLATFLYGNNFFVVPLLPQIHFTPHLPLFMSACHWGIVVLSVKENVDMPRK